MTRSRSLSPLWHVLAMLAAFGLILFATFAAHARTSPLIVSPEPARHADAAFVAAWTIESGAMIDATVDQR